MKTNLVVIVKLYKLREGDRGIVRFDANKERNIADTVLVRWIKQKSSGTFDKRFFESVITFAPAKAMTGLYSQNREVKLAQESSDQYIQTLRG